MKKILKLGLIFGAIGAVFTFVKGKMGSGAHDYEDHISEDELPSTPGTTGATPTTEVPSSVPGNVETPSAQDTSATS